MQCTGYCPDQTHLLKWKKLQVAAAPSEVDKVSARAGARAGEGRHTDAKVVNEQDDDKYDECDNDNDNNKYDNDYDNDNDNGRHIDAD